VHAVALAEDLGIALVVVPLDASVLCAAGILVTEFKHDYVRTLFGRTPAPSPDDVDQAFRALEQEAAAQLASEGVQRADVRFRHVAEVRYTGQLHTLDVGFRSGQRVTTASLAELEDDFHPAHEERFGHALRGTEVEIVNIRLEASGGGSGSDVATLERMRQVAAEERPAWFAGGFVDTPVYAALALEAGVAVSGPALVELPTSTVVVPPGTDAVANASGSLLLHPSTTTLDDVLDQLRSGGTSV
jgi:N-methylhydantoinase A